MGSAGAPEELRFFDFTEVARDPDCAPSSSRPARAEAAAALRRRVEEVSAVAHSRAPRGRRRTSALDEPRPTAEGASPVPAVTGGRAEAGGAATGAAEGGPERERNAQAEGRGASSISAAGDLAPEEGAVDHPPSEEALRPETLSIAEFYARVGRALRSVFPDEVWVAGEIRGMSERKGHHYFELVDHVVEPGGARAGAPQLEVACWARDWPRIASALSAAGVSLEVGRVVRVRGRVSVWEGGGKLRFTMTALDIEALLGSIAAARRRLLAALAAEDLLDANHRLPVPLVPLRVGLVTSPGSQAHRDFVGQLERSGFAFEVLLEPCLVQGAEAPLQIAAALHRLARATIDVVVLVRGGGARGDLAAFDSEAVARAIATAPFAVWTGIGHTGDLSVADEVAQRALITPTACGEAVVGAVRAYRDRILASGASLARLAVSRLAAEDHRLASFRSALASSSRHQLERRHDHLERHEAVLARAARAAVEANEASLHRAAGLVQAALLRLLASEERDHEARRQVLRAYDPRRQLERGWSLTHDAQGRLLRSVLEVHLGDEIVTRLADGEVHSAVDAVRVDGEARAHEEGQKGAR